MAEGQRRQRRLIQEGGQLGGLGHALIVTGQAGLVHVGRIGRHDDHGVGPGSARDARLLLSGAQGLPHAEDEALPAPDEAPGNLGQLAVLVEGERLHLAVAAAEGQRRQRRIQHELDVFAEGRAVELAGLGEGRGGESDDPRKAMK